MKEIKQLDIIQSMKKYRKAKGLSQKEVANYLGIKTSTYSSYENQHRPLPSKYILLLAKIFDLESVSESEYNETFLIKYLRSEGFIVHLVENEHEKVIEIKNKNKESCVFNDSELLDLNKSINEFIEFKLYQKMKE